MCPLPACAVGRPDFVRGTQPRHSIAGVEHTSCVARSHSIIIVSLCHTASSLCHRAQPLSYGITHEIHQWTTISAFLMPVLSLVCHNHMHNNSPCKSIAWCVCHVVCLPPCSPLAPGGEPCELWPPLEALLRRGLGSSAVHLVSGLRVKTVHRGCTGWALALRGLLSMMPGFDSLLGANASTREKDSSGPCTSQPPQWKAPPKGWIRAGVC